MSNVPSAFNQPFGGQDPSQHEFTELFSGFGPGNSRFPIASFDIYKFPVTRITIKGGIRDHIHEFPHSPGGEPEKMGRKLYTVTMVCHFHDLPELGQDFPALWPTVLGYLRQIFEEGRTSDLMIPQIGTIKAYCKDWEQIADMERALSGEEVTLTFQEDQESALLADGLFEIGGNTVSDRAHGLALASSSALADYFGQPKPTIFDDINDAVVAFQGAIDQVDAVQQVVVGKLEYLSQLCETADRDVDAFQHPKNNAILEALKDLWSASNDLANDITNSGQKILVYTTPTVMSVTDVSTAIHGDASHAMDILQLNPIEDAFAIPAGTQLRYFSAPS